MVLPFDPVSWPVPCVFLCASDTQSILFFVESQIPIIHIPGLGDVAAEVACERMKVNSQNDRVQLDKAKELTYLEGFYKGVREREREREGGWDRREE